MKNWYDNLFDSVKNQQQYLHAHWLLFKMKQSQTKEKTVIKFVKYSLEVLTTLRQNH